MSSTPEQKEKWKQQREKHKDKRHEYAKQYYNTHTEENLERVRKWKELNPDRVLEYNKKSLMKQAEQVICNICGCSSTKHHLNRHKQSIKCKQIANERAKH